MDLDEITTQEALSILGLTTPSTISRWVRYGVLKPSRKLPGRRGAFLFHRSDVEALAVTRSEQAS